LANRTTNRITHDIVEGAARRACTNVTRTSGTTLVAAES
jgi:hypothetical protein